MRPIKHMGMFLQGVTDPCFLDRGTQVCLWRLLMLRASVFPLQFTSRALFPPQFLVSKIVALNCYSYLGYACFSIYRQTGTRRLLEIENWRLA